MRMRLFSSLLLFGLALVPAPCRAAEEKAARPVVVLRVGSIDGMLADMHYMMELAGQEEKAQQAEKAIKSQLGPKGLEGIDTKKPFGVYANLKDSLENAEVFVLVPVADPKAFLALLGRTGLDLKEKDGLYTGFVPVNNQLTVHVNLRFADKYAHVKLTQAVSTLKKAELYDPSVLLPARGDLFALTFNVDQLPDNLKKTAVAIIGGSLGTMKLSEPPGETKEQKELREAVLDEVAGTLKSLIKETSTLRLGFNVDREAADVAVTLSLTAAPGSDLAGRIASLGQKPSVGASLKGPGSAVSLMLQLEVPADLRPKLAPFIDESFKKLLAKETVRDKRDVMAVVLDALAPTLKKGVLDFGFDLRGPSAGGLYTFLGGARVQDGAAIDKAFRSIVAKLPEKDRKSVKLDVDSSGGVAIHRITPEHMDKETKKRLGADSFYLAVRSDAVFVAGGFEGLKTLKESISLEPKKGDVGHLEFSAARMVGLSPSGEQAAAKAAAKKAFTEKGSDRIRIALDGGKSLRLRASMKSSVITFFSLIEKAKRGE